MAVYTTIDDAGSFFNPILYSAGSAPLAITGVGFSADFTWIKSRSYADNHNLFDTVRGATEIIYTNMNAVQDTQAQSLQSWQSDGFTLGTRNDTNRSGQTFVSWSWKAGTTTGIAGSPTITPTSYSFNATPGFSVIAYTGTGVAATLPHGLGVAPKMIIQKNLDDAENWQVYHASMGATKYILLNDVGAEQINSTRWNDTEPTSTLFSIGTDSSVNYSGEDMIAYVFADVQGYSKFGSYAGNGNADGPFVYTGFRPAFIVIKNADGVETWNMWDNKRSTSGTNLTNMNLAPSAVAAENTASAPGGQVLDLLSNGFKIRGTTTECNQSGYDMIYMAFAEAPLVNSEGVPVNAR